MIFLLDYQNRKNQELILQLTEATRRVGVRPYQKLNRGDRLTRRWKIIGCKNELSRNTVFCIVLQSRLLNVVALPDTGQQSDNSVLCNNLHYKGLRRVTVRYPEIYRVEKSRENGGCANLGVTASGQSE